MHAAGWIAAPGAGGPDAAWLWAVLAGALVVVAAMPEGGRRSSWRAASTSKPVGPRVPEGRPSRLATWAVLGALGLWIYVAPGMVLGLLALAGGTRWAIVRRRRASRSRAVADAIPDVVDLFALAAAAGIPVASALDLVAARAPPPVEAAITSAARVRARGAPLEEALAEIDRLAGPAAHELVSVLGDAARTGAPAYAALRAVAAGARHRRARAAEERARRLPVVLLLPLVCCTLPAALVLAIVPVVAASFGALAH